MIAPVKANIECAWLAAVSVVLMAVRAYAATRIGFGDSEALYASYALHAQPAYLDHPGLVGIFARALGAGAPPTPASAHLATAALATAAPWVMALACRAAGASWRRSFGTALVVALVPEMAIGLFAMTPDLLLSLAWTGSLGFAAFAMCAAPGSARATLGFGAAGLLAGIAAASKVSGLLLLPALAVAYALRPARCHARTAAPWAGLAAGLVVVLPIAAFESRTGWPMIRHRLVDTQLAAGLSLRNAGALIGGQLAYLSPLVIALFAYAGRALWRERNEPVGGLLLASCALPAAVLVPLCLWSRVAEPHWLAPAWLALAPAAARARQPVPRRLVVAAVALGACMIALVHAWVLIPAVSNLAPASCDPRLDITHELYGWDVVAAEVRAEVREAEIPGSPRGDVVVVGPHWIVCAQVEAAIRGDVPVGCDTPVDDDFDTWWPRKRWRAADTIVWVTDTRFDPPPTLGSYAELRRRQIRIRRGGRVIRVFTVATLSRRAAA